MVCLAAADTCSRLDGAARINSLQLLLLCPFYLQVMTCIFNLVWIGFALDTEAVAEGANPITSDPEAARKN